MVLSRLVPLVVLVSCRIGFEPVAVPTDGIVEPGGPGPDSPVLATCETRTVKPVPLTGAVNGTLVAGGGLDQGTCDGMQSSEDIYALDVLVPGSRIQVAADLIGSPAFVALHIRTDCDDAGTELECDQTDGRGDSPQIVRAVPPGRYFVFLDGQDGKQLGNYLATLTVLLPAGATCDPNNARDRCDANLQCIAGTCQPADCPLPNMLNGPGPHMLMVATTNAVNHHAGTCGDAGDGGLRANEFVLPLNLTAATTGITVDSDQNGTDYDTLIYVRDACQGAELACNDDASSLNAIANTGPLPAGVYLLFIDGFSTGAGTAELRVTAN